MDLNEKLYVVIVQCQIVLERCSGYFCEQAFNERSGGFGAYPKDRAYRLVNIGCGGCCGLALHRKLTHLLRQLEKREGIGKEHVVLQLSSCITRDNFHGPPCPHLDYLKDLITRLGVDFREDTRISGLSEERREAGRYRS